MTTDLATLGLAVDSGPVAKAADELKKFQSAAKGAEQSAQRVGQEFSKASETAKRMASSVNSAAAINARLGIGVGGAGADQRKADFEAAAALDDLRAKYVPLYAIQRNYKAQLLEINDAHRVGAISAEEHALAVAYAENAYVAQTQAVKVNSVALAETGKSAALTGFQMNNLAFQINDVFTQLALGMPIYRIAAAQGGQFYQILAQGQGGLVGSTKYLIGVLGGLLTPLRLAVTAATALGAVGLYVVSSWRGADREARLALTGIGSAAGVTRKELEAIALAAADTQKVSVDAARTMALQFISTGKITGDVAAKLIDLTKGTAALFGESNVEAADRLAQAFADPAKGVDELNKRLLVFDAATRNNIRNLAEQGNRVAAQKMLLEGTIPVIKASEAEVGLLSRTWQSVSANVSDYADKLGKALDGATGGGPLEQQLANAKASLKEMQNYKFLGILAVSPSTIAAQADRVADLTEKVRALNKSAEEAPIIQKSLEVSDLIRTTIAELRQLEDASNALNALKVAENFPAAVTRTGEIEQAQLKNAIRLRQEEVDSIRLRLQYQMSAADAARQENLFAVQAINARSAAERAEVAYRQTLAKELRSGNVAAEIEAQSAKTQILAQENRRVSDEIRSRNFAAAQAIELATLELSLVGKTADEAARITAAFKARQQVQASAFENFRTASAAEIHEAEIRARERADIESRTRRAQILADLDFERQQLARSGTEQAVYDRLNSAGALQNGEIVGAQNQMIADRIRFNEQLRESINIQSEFASSFLRDMIAGKSATEALSNSLSRLADRMLDNSIDLLFSGLAKSGAVPVGGLFGGSILPGVFHSGGIAGANDNQPRRSVPAAAFAGAPRYHSGGIAGLRPDEIPAILQKGERIVPNGAAGGAGALTVHVSLDSDLLRAVVVDESGRQIAASAGQLRQEMQRTSLDTVRLARDRRLA